jgi:hypothetical protein
VPLAPQALVLANIITTAVTTGWQTCALKAPSGLLRFAYIGHNLHRNLRIEQRAAQS